MSKLLVERREAVTLLTLNRPDVHNDVDDEVAMALADAIIEFRDAHEVVPAGAAGERPAPPCARDTDGTAP